MKLIGLITPCYIAKAKKTFDFADKIIFIENIGPDKTAYGQASIIDRLKVTYKFNNRVQTTTISSQWGTKKIPKR